MTTIDEAREKLWQAVLGLHEVADGDIVAIMWRDALAQFEAVAGARTDAAEVALHKVRREALLDFGSASVSERVLLHVSDGLAGIIPCPKCAERIPALGAMR